MMVSMKAWIVIQILNSNKITLKPIKPLHDIICKEENDITKIKNKQRVLSMEPIDKHSQENKILSPKIGMNIYGS